MIIREYEVKNLECAGCSAKIEGEIANLLEVDRVNLDFINKRLIIQYKNDNENVLAKLNRIAAKIEPGAFFHAPGEDIINTKSAYTMFIFAGLLLWLIVQIINPSSGIFMILSIMAFLMVSARVLKSAAREVFSHQLMAEHFLMSIAGIGALYLGEYTEAIAVMALYEFGQYLEARAITKSKQTVAGIMSLKPDLAHVKLENNVQDKRLNMVHPGDILYVHPGERIPLDSKILKGVSTLDTSSVSGESTPQPVKPGDEVFAGYLNQGGLLEMEVLRKENESMIARILSLIENAVVRKSRQERFITRFARVYTPVVVGLAVLVFLIPILMGYPVTIWLERALVFLIVSCPCALVISIPLTYYIGIGLAARKGIIFKGSVYLDSLRQIKSLVFDKTGTLTTGKLKLESFLPVEDVRLEELQTALWLSEYNSQHPFALAVKDAMSLNYNFDEQHEFEEIPGRGIRLRYGNDLYRAGSDDYLISLGFKNVLQLDALSLVHVAKNNRYLGIVAFSDEIKQNMPSILSRLRNMGVKNISMLSGDKASKADQVAKLLKLDFFKAELLPHHKLHVLEDIMKSKQHKVAYVGDGMNDAPVLARADIGIAMGSIGAQASIDSADIVLLNDKPEQLLQAFQLSKATNSKVWQNIILALGIKLLVMILGIAGFSGLWEAIIADVGVTLLVIFNSLTLTRIVSTLDKN